MRTIPYLIAIILFIGSHNAFSQNYPAFSMNAIQPVPIGNSFLATSLVDGYQGRGGFSIIGDLGKKPILRFSVKLDASFYRLNRGDSFLLVISPKVGMSSMNYVNKRLAFLHYLHAGYSSWSFDTTVNSRGNGFTIELGERLAIDLGQSVSLMLGLDYEMTKLRRGNLTIDGFILALKPSIGLGFR